MKRKILSIFSLILCAIGVQVILTSSSNGRAFAANSGNTGAPGESTTCRTCHGSAFGTTVTISVRDANGAVSSYIPGTIYDVDFTINSTGASRYGFQLVSMNSTNGAVNGFSSPSANTRLVTLGNGRQYAEHRGKSTTSTFSTKWTAPAAGTGNITFYGGGAAVDNNGGTRGDGGNTSSLILSENTAVGLGEDQLEESFQVYPNPTNNVINLKNLANVQGDIRAEMYTASGQIVLSRELNLTGSDDNRLNVSTFEKGLYVLRITSGKNSLEKKIIIND